jgi:hypothetical protein
VSHPKAIIHLSSSLSLFACVEKDIFYEILVTFILISSSLDECLQGTPSLVMEALLGMSRCLYSFLNLMSSKTFHCHNGLMISKMNVHPAPPLLSGIRIVAHFPSHSWIHICSKQALWKCHMSNEDSFFYLILGPTTYYSLTLEKRRHLSAYFANG